MLPSSIGPEQIAQGEGQQRHHQPDRRGNQRFTQTRIHAAGALPGPIETRKGSHQASDRAQQAQQRSQGRHGLQPQVKAPQLGPFGLGGGAEGQAKGDRVGAV